MSIGPIAIPTPAAPLDIRRLHAECEPVAVASWSPALAFRNDPLDPNEAHALRPIPVIAPRQQQIPDLTDTFDDQESP